MEDIRQIGNGKIRGGEILLHQLANLCGIDDLIFGFGLEKAQKLSDMGLDFRLFFPVGEAAAEIQGLKIKLAVVLELDVYLVHGIYDGGQDVYEHTAHKKSGSVFSVEKELSIRAKSCRILDSAPGKSCSFRACASPSRMS